MMNNRSNIYNKLYEDIYVDIYFADLTVINSIGYSFSTFCFDSINSH